MFGVGNNFEFCFFFVKIGFEIFYSFDQSVFVIVIVYNEESVDFVFFYFFFYVVVLECLVVVFEVFDVVFCYYVSYLFGNFRFFSYGVRMELFFYCYIGQVLDVFFSYYNVVFLGSCVGIRVGNVEVVGYDFVYQFGVFECKFECGGIVYRDVD